MCEYICMIKVCKCMHILGGARLHNSTSHKLIDMYTNFNFHMYIYLIVYLCTYTFESYQYSEGEVSVLIKCFKKSLRCSYLT